MRLLSLRCSQFYTSLSHALLRTALPPYPPLFLIVPLLPPLPLPKSSQCINRTQLPTGRLAVLAHEQENQDRDLLLINRQKIQSMPHYWLEMLEIEVLAR